MKELAVKLALLFFLHVQIPSMLMYHSWDD